jgi:DNA-binding NtrC family response regulator
MGILIVGLDRTAVQTPGVSAECVLTSAETRALLSRKSYDAVVVGPNVPDASVDDLVRDIARHPDLPVVLVGDAGDSVKRAVWEHVPQPGDQLAGAIARALEVGRLRRARPAAGADHELYRVFQAGSIRAMERLMILGRLERLNQNRTRSAASLEISVRTLRNKLREYRTSNATEPVTIEDR